MRIAIIGAGVSGLYAAHLLHKRHEITVFEAADYPGGHTHTVEVELDGQTVAVDTGFIVHNNRNYPLFIALLKELGVAAQDGEMSFSMSCELSGLEYSGSNLNTLFAQRRNLMRPAFYRMLADILRFNRLRDELVNAPASESLQGFLQRHRLSGAVVDDYLVPMAAAIWSSDPLHILDFPAAYFGRFFANHGLLSVNDRPQWRTVCGGSKRYVEPLIRPFLNRVLLNTPVERVERSPTEVKITATSTGTQNFDQVIFACHSDHALAMLSNPTAQEQDILGGIPFQENDTVLHTDARLLPRNQRAWAAWNYHRFRNDAREVCVTYNMTMLQRLASPTPLLVSLNATRRIHPETILRRIRYHHPVYNQASVAARNRWKEISNHNRTHYCGAYWGYGFHEDGLRSAVAVVESLGETLQLNH